MELLRLHPFPLEFSYSGLPASTDLTAAFFNDRGIPVSSIEATSDIDGIVTFETAPELTNFDGRYKVRVFVTDANYNFWEGYDSDPEVLVLDSIDIIRPYVDPKTIAPSPEQILEYTKYERIARIMIDNIVGGFYYTKDSLGFQGVGANKLPIGRRIIRINSIVEDGVVTFNSSLPDEENVKLYSIAPDYHAIIVKGTDGNYTNEDKIRPISDPYSIVGHLPTKSQFSFINGKTYVVTFEYGWPVLPQDIKEAVKLLIEDVSCNGPNYWSKYVREYETKDYRIDFHRTTFSGTGNLIVDQTLKRYWGQTLYDNVRVL